MPLPSPIPGVSIAIFKERDVLLVKRARPPYQGYWSLPGGRIEWGETAEQAVRRECLEETGLHVGALTLAGLRDAILREGADGAVSTHFVISVFAARYTGGSPLASSDALEACWAGIDALADLLLTPGLSKAIELAHTAIKSAGADYAS